MRRILIIEDEETLRTEISEVLKFEGFQIIQAGDGEAGLQLARAEKPDLILCDIMMPHMKGTEVLLNLLESESTSQIPFIFITALGERTDVRSGMELGADDYLVKPFSVKELINSINTRFEKFEIRQKVLQSTVNGIKSDLSRKVNQLKEKLIEKNNDIDLLKLEKQLLKDEQTEIQSIEESLHFIDSRNRIQNLEKLVNKELKNKQLQKNTEQFYVNLRNEINKHSALVDNWSVFQLRFNQLHPVFADNLLSKFPELKQSEIALASAITMNLGTLQIAALLNITAASVRKSKYRLKRKMDLPKTESLTKFLHTLDQ